MAEDASKYAVFISYSHADETWGKWLHQRLERYRVPPRLVGKQGVRGTVPRRIGRCFRDQAELSAASDLGETLQQALRDSRVLIVVCSPRSATSHWVNEEIKFFRGLGRADSIYALIVDGVPNATDPASECFPPALRRRDDGAVFHPLAADARERADGKTDGFLKLAAGVLGVGFDELRQRERRRRARLMIATISVFIGIATVTSALAISAYRARNEAQFRRQQADALIDFMLGDLRNRLQELGRLDILDATVNRTMEYLGGADIEQLSADALAQRSRALTQISGLAYARGDMPQAAETAQGALSAARALQRARPGDHSDELLSRALNARSAPLIEVGDFDTALPMVAEALAIARRLHAASPDDSNLSLLNADVADLMAYIDLASPKRDFARAERNLLECIQLLRPLTQRVGAESRLVRQQLRCEGTIIAMITALDQHARRPELLAPAVSAAKGVARDYPRTPSLHAQALYVLTEAVKGFSRSGRLDEAADASAAALEIGGRLVSLEPDDKDLLASFAEAVIADLMLRIKREDWLEAERKAGQAKLLFDQLLERNADSESWRRSALKLYGSRAVLAARKPEGRARALAEIRMGLDLVHDDDKSPPFLTEALSLVLQQWLYSVGDDGSVRSAQAKAHQFVERLTGVNNAVLDACLAKLAYLEGRIADGDRLYQTLRENRSSHLSDVENYRRSACEDHVDGGGCPLVPG